MNNRRSVRSICHLFFCVLCTAGGFNALTVDPTRSTINTIVFQIVLPTSSHVIPVLGFDCPNAYDVTAAVTTIAAAYINPNIAQANVPFESVKFVGLFEQYANKL